MRGWTRAGALVGLFGSAHAGVDCPTKIFASDPNEVTGQHGRRAVETIARLAEARGISLDTTFAVGDEADIAKAMLLEQGVVLVSWEHHNIPRIVRGIGVREFADDWPDLRFDLVRICRMSGG